MKTRVTNRHHEPNPSNAASAPHLQERAQLFEPLPTPVVFTVGLVFTFTVTFMWIGFGA